MDLSKLMETSPENLAKLQYNELKAFAVITLENVLAYLKQENFEIIRNKYLFDSPAGDGHGSDNRCIDFSYDDKQTYSTDIGDILDTLEGLKKIMNEKQIK